MIKVIMCYLVIFIIIGIMEVLIVFLPEIFLFICYLSIINVNNGINRVNVQAVNIKKTILVFVFTN